MKKSEISLNDIKTKEIKTVEEGISLDDIKLSEKEQVEKLSIDNIKTSTQTKENSKQGIGHISVAEPKLSGNSIVSAVAEKKYEDIKESEAEVSRSMNNKHPYIYKGSILTNAEKTLYNFLRENLPEGVTIMVKVRLADIIEVNEKITRDKSHFYNIAYKCIDYLICDSEDLSLICAVELGDYERDTPARLERDKFVYEVLRECGIKLFRIKFKIAALEKRDIRGIENHVYKTKAPTCDKCGSEMGAYKRRDETRLYRCKNMGECENTIDID